MKNDIKDIIQACLRQERKAQQALFDLYNYKLYVSACAYLNDEEKAKEIMQETWIDVFKGLSKYDASKSQISTWMKTIMVRKIWAMRNKKRFTENLDSVANKTISNEIILDKMSCEEILSEMDKIPAASRMVFKMYVLHGYKHAEIAKMLNITASTSRVHLTKARSIMKIRYATINQEISQ